MNEGTEQFVHANGIDIYYRRTGGEGNPPLLLLHGVTDSGACWPLVTRDLQEKYDVIRPDARGHGRSSGVETGFSTELLAQDVLALIEQLKLEKPLLFGHSMGGRTALHAASMSNQLRGVILEDPPLRDMPQPSEQVNIQGRQWGWQWVYDSKALSDEERQAKCREENPAWAEEEIGPWSASKAEFNLDVIPYLGSLMGSWRDLLARISCPVLLITGDTKRGAIVTPEIAQEAIALCKQGTLAHIEGAGHNIHRERYQPTMAAVFDFLKTV